MDQLKRRLSLTKLSFFGVGDILGAGIYALVGKVAWEAGNLAWFAFLFAGVAALPTALSYAELSSRYPKAGGASVFAGRAFRNVYIPFIVGFIVLLSGLNSSATVANAFHGYFSTITAIPRWFSVISFLAVLSWISFRGIEESSWLNIICVIAEAGGLILIIAFGWMYWGDVDLMAGRLGEGLLSKESLSGIASAAVLSFYATIGFEDICNVSEEVKNPTKTVPRAILISLSIAALIYIAIAITVVSAASIQELGESSAPLAMVAAKIIPHFSPKYLAILALFSLTNTALANMIMASRLLYGMSREGWIFKIMGKVHEGRKTPAVAIFVVFILVTTLALSGTLKILGQTTSVIILTVFVLVNLSLFVIRIRNIPPDEEANSIFKIPIIVPLFGIVVSAFLVLQAPIEAFIRMGILLIIGFILYLIYKILPSK